MSIRAELDAWNRAVAQWKEYQRFVRADYGPSVGMYAQWLDGLYMMSLLATESWPYRSPEQVARGE